MFATTFLSDYTAAFSSNRSVGVALALTIILAGCSSPAPPMAIRMYNPKTNQTLHCTARSDSGAHVTILAGAVESCARQLEAHGFVRDK